MKYNPKVVSIDRSAAYVHHRAMKNRRDNNPLDALELLRHAVERSPENMEYKLDLAEMYCELGYHEKSNRILLDLLAAGEEAPPECYYGLALNQLGMNDLNAAQRALMLYQAHAGDDEYIAEAYGLSAEIELFHTLKRPANRRSGRANQIAARACDALKDEDYARARRLFERSFSFDADQPEMRALYAMTLHLSGDDEQALAEAERSSVHPDAGVRALSVDAQVFYLCNQKKRARQMIRQAIDAQPEGVELRLMIYALGEMDMPEEAAAALKTALHEAPHDKLLLHMRAVALHKSGADDALSEPFWLRILRIDPDDTIARYYHDAALRGELKSCEAEYAYEVPRKEYRRRLSRIADVLSGGLAEAVEHWRNDHEFHELLLWAVHTDDENCGRAAVMVIASADDADSESALREILYREDVPLSVKIHAQLFLQLRSAKLQNLLPPDVDASDGLLPDADTMLADLPVGERQLVRFAEEVLVRDYDVTALPALTVMWCAYRHRLAGRDPLICTQEAAAALAWNYLLHRGMKPEADKLVEQFECRKRRMVYYAAHMASVLNRNEDGADDERD